MLPQTLRFLFQHPLTRHAPARAFARFAAWQLRCRLRPKPHAMPWVDHTRLYVARGWHGVTGNLYAGLHEFHDMGFLLHFLREHDRFVDVGANHGSYTVLAAAARGAETWCFEPVPKTYQRLLDNIRLNHIEHRTHPLAAAAGSQAGALLFTTAEDTTNHVATAADSQTAPVPVVTLDDTLPLAPTLLKIDVEGYETEVLRGAAQILRNPALQAIIIELNGCGERYGYDEAAIHQQLLQLDFSPCQYDPFSRTLTPTDSFGTHNTIYCRDLDAARERVRTGKAFRVLGQTI